MLRRRTIKQASYAGAGLLLVLVVAAGLAAWRRSPQPSAVVSPTPSSFYQPIVVEQVFSVLHHNTIDIAARLRNVNVRAGIAIYPVDFIIQDEAGREQSRRQETTYLLPGNLQYVVALNVPVSSRRPRVRLEVPPQPAWQELPGDLRLPQFGSFLRGVPQARTVGAAVIEQQKGIASNEGSYDLQRVEVVALALTAHKDVVGIGKTFLGELKVGERREFTVQWPAPDQPTSEVVSWLSANIFQEENVIRVIGDPSTLR